jgi:polysaccharide pyruvyl transferase WcaK-like protein
MNIIVTGYYNHNNLGDDLFEKIARTIFIKDKHINKIEYVKIEAINSNEITFKCDKLILFGGNVLNNYFLDFIIKFSKNNPQTLFYAIGVSSDQPLETIINKISIFQQILFRSKEEYLYFKPIFKSFCSYVPDIVFTTTYRQPLINLKKQNKVGFFLATPIYAASLNKKSYIQNIILMINYFLEREFIIYFFPMCTNSNNVNEDDNVLIKLITNTYPPQKQSHFKLFNTNKNILNDLSQMKYNICWRFHSVILSIIYNIPFITLSMTPKVKNLLRDNNLEECAVTETNFIEKLDWMIQNKKNIKTKLKNLYTQLHSEAKQIYYNLSSYSVIRNAPPFYIDPKDDYPLIIKYIGNKYKLFYSSTDTYLNSNIIIFNLIKSIDTEYNYGLESKLYKGFDALYNDLCWLIDQQILKSNMIFYWNVLPVLPTKSLNKQFKLVEPNKININYIDQYDMAGLHRAGWTFVVNSLSDIHHPNGIICDFYLDRTFHWNHNTYANLNVIPYKTPWIGFIHHTMNQSYSDNNTYKLFQNTNFLKSLSHCKGLIVLTSHLKLGIEAILPDNHKHIPIFVLTHPTEFVENNFSMEKFKLNTEKKIIQIGSWMRDLSAIKDIEIDHMLLIHKCVLIGKKMESAYADLHTELHTEDSTTIVDEFKEISSILTSNTQNGLICRKLNNPTKSVNLNNNIMKLEYVSNDDFDKLLSSNLVFIKLIDASAINTLIECIVRNTPIVINKIAPVVEMLGDKYPLYFIENSEVKNLLTIKNIELAYNYLQKMDKTIFRIETFKKEFNKVLTKIIY